MKKKLFTLLLCAFAWIGANAWTVSFSDDGKTAYIVGGGTSDTNNWTEAFTAEERAKISAATELVFTGTINTLKPFESNCDNATIVDFSGATFVETDDGTVNYQAWDPESKTYKDATVKKTKNCMTFSIFPNCSTAKLASVKTICHGCFQNNFQLTTTFVIPESVEYIADFAVEDTPIKDITIPATVKYIQKEAFQNDAVNNLIDVTVEGYTYAEHGAFDKDITVGQTVANKLRYASLHFTAGSEEFFTNTKHTLDLETSLDAGKFQVWLNGHYEDSSNGWQDFINSSPGKGDPVPSSNPVILRTFSDNVAHYVPLCYRAYLVNGVKGNDKDGYTLDLVETFAIPANTGVIIYGEAETGSFALPILSGASWNTTPYTRETTTTVTVDNETISLRNYLVANCTLKAGTKIGPYELGSDGKVAERNFVLGPYSKTDVYDNSYDDYVAFFRAKTMTPGKNKAHLKLPNTIFSNPKGVELIPVNPSTFRENEWPKIYPGNWGKKTSPVYSKSFGEPFEDEYEATGISNVKSENTDDAIYNLQGVKVANPVKGVYVKGGKKIIIK